MLKIRKEQMLAMARHTREPLVAKAAAWLSEKEPAKAAPLGEEGLSAAVRSAFESSEAYDITAEWDLFRYAWLALVYGPEFDKRCDWAATALQDEDATPTEKLDTLEFYHINYAPKPPAASSDMNAEDDLGES